MHLFYAGRLVSIFEGRFQNPSRPPGSLPYNRRTRSPLWSLKFVDLRKASDDIRAEIKWEMVSEVRNWGMRDFSTTDAPGGSGEMVERTRQKSLADPTPQVSASPPTLDQLFLLGQTRERRHIQVGDLDLS